ncbi:dihydroxy-acid dehydratase domain-containing protein [Methylomonas montana]|nr:dihydroxy-acid dehydratase [Methylomonas montana]
MAIVQNGDEITIDAETKQLTLHVTEHEIARRFEKKAATGTAL